MDQGYLDETKGVCYRASKLFNIYERWSNEAYYAIKRRGK
jgi:hypothetical protein